MFALATLLGILTASTPEPAAAPVAVPAEVVLAAEEVVLTGDHARAQFTVELAASGEIALELPVRWSHTIDAARSSITIAIDDAPLATAWLATLGDDRGVVRAVTATLPAGYHRVAIRAHLRIGDDACRRLEADEAWLAIEPAARARVPRSPVPTLSAQLARLRAPDRTALVIALGGADAERAAPDEILAYLDADAVARAWRLAPRRVAAGRPADLSVTWDAPAPAVAGATARIDAAGDGLRVEASSIAGARAALASLADERFVAACTALPCLVGAAPVPAIDAGAEPTEGRRSIVTRIGAIGHPQGFTADGEGVHVLRFTRHRSVYRRKQPSPELHLLVSVPEGGALDRAASAVRIAVNGRPIASFDLRNAQEGQLHLIARVPDAMWRDPAWAFDVALHLVATDGQRCARDEAGLWAVIEPDSYLSVVSADEQREGLAEVLTLARRVRPPLVEETPVAWAQVPGLAAVVAPLASATPALPWRWAAACEAPLCIVPGDAAPGRRATLAASAGVPLSDDSALLQRAACDIGSCTRLEVFLPHTGAALPAPDYAALRTTRAVAHGDRWHVAIEGRAPRTRLVVEERDPRAGWPRPAASHEARRMVRRDVVWAGIAIATLAGLFVWFRRRK